MRISIFLFVLFFLAGCGSGADDSTAQLTLAGTATIGSNSNQESNHSSDDIITGPDGLSAEAEGRSRVILRWTPATTTTSTRVLRDSREVADTTDAFYVDSNLTESVRYNYQISQCVAGICAEPSEPLVYISRNFDLINVSPEGFDDSFRNEIGVNLLFRGQTGQRFVNRSLLITIPKLQNIGRTYGDGVYKLEIRSDPAFGQQCISSASSREFLSGGLDTNVNINCQTPAILASAAKTINLENGFSSMSSPKIAVKRNADNHPIYTEKFRFTSSNPSVASINNAGVITTKADGTAKIQAFLEPAMYGDGANVSYDVNVTSRLSYKIRKVDFGQNLVFKNGKQAKLASNKNALVRVFLQAKSASNLRSPALSLLLITGSNTEILTMTCPARLNTSYAETFDYTLNNACYVQINENKIADNTQFFIRDTSANQNFNITPKVFENNYLSLVIVPFSVNGTKPIVADFDTIKKSIKKRLPFANIDIQVKPVQAVSESSPSMTSLLRATESIRMRENGGISLGLQQSHYVGVVADVLERRVLGIGFVGGNSIVIKDDFTDSTLEHELGHNFGLNHAACGNPAGVDPFWLQSPEAWPGANFGKNSLVPIFDPVTKKLLSPRAGDRATEYDIMGYCGGEYFSEYNLGKILRQIDKNDMYHKIGTRAFSRESQALVPSNNILTISGVITGNIVESVVVEKSTGSENAADGLYVLYYKDATGTLRYSYFTPLVASDGVSKLFFINIPEQSAIELLYIFTDTNKKIIIDKKWSKAQQS